MKLSIIIPVYNAENDIGRCVESIKTINEIDYECIIIDDGSTDNTWLKLKKYTENIPQFIIKHITNGGVSNARNIALNLSSGDKILFLDADDYLLSDAGDILKKNMAFNDDLIIFTHKNVVNGQIKENYIYPNILGLSYTEALIKLTIENQCLNNCWGKLFKSEIIKNNKIRFDSQMKIGEDAKFVLEYLQESSSLKICNLPLQAYIINEEGAMRKAGLEALGDEIKTYEARINTLRNLQVEISDELMQVLNLTYYNKIIGYLIQDSHKFGVVKNYENICRYIVRGIMKIGIVTLIYATKFDNYGGTLQNYALSQVLSDMGHEVSTIALYYSKEPFCLYGKIRRKLYCKYGIDVRISKKGIQCAKVEKYQKKRNDNFLQFRSEKIHTDTRWIEKNNFRNLDSEYDLFIVGSDQVWNPYWAVNKTTFDGFFLRFAKKDKRVSYAASFGVSMIPENQISDYTKALLEFKRISVREDAGASIIKNLCNREAQVVLDPTLLLDKCQWECIQKKMLNIQTDSPYILTYFLGEMPENAKDYIEKAFSIKGEMKIYNLAKQNEKDLYALGPSEFIYMISHAKLILTDSFHACVFSFIFEKPFIVFDRQDNTADMMSRIENLLKTFSIERKYASSGMENDLFEADYQIGHTILNEKRKESIKYLENISDSSGK